MDPSPPSPSSSPQVGAGMDLTVPSDAATVTPAAPYAAPYAELWRATPPRRFAHVNRVTLLGGVFAFVGGVLYAVSDLGYASVAGAADPFSYGWVFQLTGISYLLIGFGILLGFAGLESGLTTVGGGVAFVGALLAAIGRFGYAALRGTVAYSGLAWTDVIDGIGFFLLGVGLLLGFGGLAASRPQKQQGVLGRPPPFVPDAMDTIRR